MRVNDFMTPNPATCAADTPLVDVARLMVKHDCGEIPIIDRDNRHLIGVVTDRDIVCRVVAEGRDPAQTAAGEAMTTPVVCTSPDATLEECSRVMEENRIRRVPVVDDRGLICGIVSQADIALAAGTKDAGRLVTTLSEPTASPSAVTMPGH